MFTNVFVNPALYRAFVGSGRWPDKTIFMLRGPPHRHRPPAEPGRPVPGGGRRARGPRPRRVEGRLALLRLRRQELGQPAVGDVVLQHLPRGARRGRQHVRAVLSGAADGREGQGHDQARFRPRPGGAQALKPAPCPARDSCLAGGARPQLTRAPGRSPRPYLAFRLQPRSPVPAAAGTASPIRWRSTGPPRRAAWTWSPSPITTASTAASSC